MASQIPPDVIDDVSEQIRTNYMGFASFTILIWDHVDTFTAEGRRLSTYGKDGKDPVVRIPTEMGIPEGPVIPESISDTFGRIFHPSGKQICNHFIRFEGSMTVIGINIVAMMMLLRVKALYHRHYWVIGTVVFLWLFQLCMNSWLLTRGEAVVHNKASGVVACTMIFDPAIKLASSSAWLPLLYDTVVLILTLNRTLPSLRNKNSSYVMKRLLEDGLIYYTAIFAVTLVLTIMIVAAPPGIKNITAQLELLITVTMMSRITLNLKKSAHKVHDTGIRPELPSLFTQQSRLHANSNIKIVTPGFDNQRRVGPTFGTGSVDTTFLGGGDGDEDVAFPMVRVPNYYRRNTHLSTITQESSNYELGVGKSSPAGVGRAAFEEGAETEEDLRGSVTIVYPVIVVVLMCVLSAIRADGGMTPIEAKIGNDGSRHHSVKFLIKPHSQISLLLLLHLATYLLTESMAAPAHYIRTIHTSFTAAHPSGAWANAASNTARSNVLLTVNNNTHHPYHQHQQAQAQLQVQHKYPPGLGLPSGSGGRRRARNPPLPSSSASQPRPPYKFDPFADEPLYTSPPPSSSPFSAAHSVLYNTPPQTQPSSSHPLLYSTPSRPYTIQIPPAGPTEVIRATSSTSRFYEFSAADKEAKAKLVAGILLNRVHAVGKPIRRRPSVGEQPRAYVKSGLSRVVSVEA
ncbi:uncharacterized protein LACBIDRAFT_292466 [Laccaria bicolor S238N-H82]|uniref:Predicted protein n=1 Tax=Laccaria bicolor (strain S238N-H82 / ATCC MYA-4686) TaxID=486041 RepID=B0CUY5_LACBS|nr:uncharacterized protein LACBIDRAFT_292466 [Laccaria bicolor S238N-H82]EDR13649.1 predicted protein [Laccaria bicolor S238N-H82]|eukprot:XP_001876147.1 predicted protein [Laccaria bicolor S238N-H82]